MKFNEVMIHYDYNMAKIARALGVTQQFVSTWKKKDLIPIERQCQLEVITDGALRANRELLNIEDK